MVQRFVAVTFDDFLTLRYSAGGEEDIIYPVLRSLKQQAVDVDEEEFLNQYFELDRRYREQRRETLLESTIDEIVLSTLAVCGYQREGMRDIVRRACNYGLGTRKTKWFPDAKRTLHTLRNRGFKLGVISNTHWGWLNKVRREFERFFDVVTLSCDHGFAKPHPSIFITTLKLLTVEPARCLHVGDNPVADIEGAKGVGMKTVFVKRDERVADADFVIQQLGELNGLI